MYITQRFQKSVILLFWLSLVLISFNAALDYFDLIGIIRNQPNSPLRIAANIFRSCLYIAIFWWVIAFYTQEKKGALIAASVSVLHALVSIYESINYDWREAVVPFWLYMILSISTFSVFGYLYYKNAKGLLLGFTYLLIWSLNSWSVEYQAVRFLSDLAYSFRFRDLGNFIDGNEYIFRAVFSISSTILEFVFFWLIFNFIKYSTLDFSLRSININGQIGRKAISILFWTFNLLFLGLLIQASKISDFIQHSEFDYSYFFQLICMAVAMYIFGSIYRNVFTAYLTQQNQYPGWLYYFINFPLLNLLLWGVLMAKHERRAGSEEEVSKLKKEFTFDDRNRKVLLVFILLTILPVVNLGRSFVGEHKILFMLIGIPISIFIVVYYYSSSNAVYILSLLKAILFLSLYTFKPELAIPALGLTTIYFLAYHYALFHFDKFTIEVEPVKTEKQLA